MRTIRSVNAHSALYEWAVYLHLNRCPDCDDWSGTFCEGYRRIPFLVDELVDDFLEKVRGLSPTLDELVERQRREES